MTSTTMRANMLLADAAQVVNSKLYVLGGGWNIVGPAGRPLNMALAINLTVPWNETNQKHRFVARLLTEDGQPVNDPNGNAVQVEGEFEMGRPPGTKPGTSFNVPFAAQLNPPLPAGGYRWEFAVDGTTLAEESFTVISRPAVPGG